MLNAINDPIVDEVIKDPGRIYDTPDEVLRDSHLSKEEKEIILENWEQDQIALLRAEEENMTGDTKAVNAAPLLQEIEKARKKLRRLH